MGCRNGGRYHGGICLYKGTVIILFQFIFGGFGAEAYVYAYWCFELIRTLESTVHFVVRR
jgi:hypothetical protein